MADTAELRRRVRQYLYGANPTERPFETLVTEALDNSETDVDVTDGNDWAVGDIAESVETGEQMYVTGVSTNTLTVIRGVGAVAAAAVTINTRLRRSPRFTTDQIDQAITNTLNNLSSAGIHGFSTGSLTIVANQYYYGLTETDIDDTYGVLSVYYVSTDGHELPTTIPHRRHSELSTSPAEWSQSHGVTLINHGDLEAGDTAYYTYAQSLNFDTDLDTTIAKLLVPQEEIVVLGAVTSLMGMTIIPATHDPGARTDRTVQPGQTSRDARWYQGQFFIRSREEAARLAVLRKQVAPGSVRTARVRRWRV